MDIYADTFPNNENIHLHTDVKYNPSQTFQIHTGW